MCAYMEDGEGKQTRQERKSRASLHDPCALTSDEEIILCHMFDCTSLPAMLQRERTNAREREEHDIHTVFIGAETTDSTSMCVATWSGIPSHPVFVASSARGQSEEAHVRNVCTHTDATTWDTRSPRYAV